MIKGVMLAFPIDFARITYPCIAQIKLDGMRGVYYDGAFYTRTLKLIRGLDHLVSELKQKGAECLDGELMIPGLTFEEASGLLRNHEETPNARFHVFDMPECYEQNTLKKIELLEKYRSEYVIPTGWMICNNRSMLKDYYDAALEAGHEGVVVKPMNYEYVPRRSYNYMKMKEVATEDLLVEGYFEGTGRLVGKLGGLVCIYKGRQVRVGSGLSDTQRENLWKERRTLPGRVAEVSYHQITAKGSLRHPRFERWREDKEDGTDS